MMRTLGLVLCMFAAAPLMADDLVGIVTDIDGKPLENVRVDISVAAPKVGRPMYCPSCYLDCAKWAKTDAEGRFTLKDLDPALKFHLIALAPGKVSTRTEALVDPANDKVVIRLLDEPEVDEDHLLLGQIVDVNNVPVPGAYVEPCGARKGGSWRGGSIAGARVAVTNDQGQFRMPLDDDFESLELEVTATGSSGMITSSLSPGIIEHVIRIPTGTSVRGKVATSKGPAPNQSVAVVQMNRIGDNHFIKAVLTTSDIDGNFEFKNLPADQPYVVFTPRGVESTGLSMRTTMFHAGGNDKVNDIGTLELSPGYRLAGKLVSVDSEPLPTDIQLLLGREPAWDYVQIPLQENGSFAIDNLPVEDYIVYVNVKGWVIDREKANYHLQDTNIVAWGLNKDMIDLDIPLRRVRADEEHIEHAKNSFSDTKPKSGSQSLSGIVVDRSGQPVSGIDLRVETAVVNYQYLNGPKTQSGSDGKFSLSDLPDEHLKIRFLDSTVKGYPLMQYNIKYDHAGFVYPVLNQQDIRIVYDPDVIVPLVESKKSPPKQLVQPTGGSPFKLR